MPENQKFRKIFAKIKRGCLMNYYTSENEIYAVLLHKSVPFRLQGQALRVLEKISTPHCVRVVFFPKTLLAGNTH